MRLSEYPYVVVRIACSRCARQGQYRLARLADKYGSEIAMPALLDHLAADCDLRDYRLRVGTYCGAFFPDMSGPRPPDKPVEARPRLKVVRLPVPFLDPVPLADRLHARKARLGLEPGLLDGDDDA